MYSMIPQFGYYLRGSGSRAVEGKNASTSTCLLTEVSAILQKSRKTLYVDRLSYRI